MCSSILLSESIQKLKMYIVNSRANTKDREYITNKQIVEIKWNHKKIQLIQSQVEKEDKRNKKQMRQTEKNL